MPTTCGKCNAKLPDEVPGLATSERTLCPTCNSTARNFAIELKATVGAHAQLSRKARARGEKKPFIEGKSGDDLYRKTGRWSVLDRTLDRRKDQYDERIVDKETGEPIRECHEPLTKHEGHGSAKAKKPRS